MKLIYHLWGEWEGRETFSINFLTFDRGPQGLAEKERKEKHSQSTVSPLIEAPRVWLRRRGRRKKRNILKRKTTEGIQKTKSKKRNTNQTKLLRQDLRVLFWVPPLPVLLGWRFLLLIYWLFFEVTVWISTLVLACCLRGRHLRGWPRFLMRVFRRWLRGCSWRGIRGCPCLVAVAGIGSTSKFNLYAFSLFYTRRTIKWENQKRIELGFGWI